MDKIAFYKIDRFPFLASGKITKKFEDGYVQVEGGKGKGFKLILELDVHEGMKLQESVEFATSVCELAKNVEDKKCLLTLKDLMEKYTPKNFGFWKTDIYPFLISSKIIERCEDGLVVTENFVGKCTAPSFELNYEEGLAKHELLKRDSEIYQASLAELKRLEEQAKVHAEEMVRKC